MNVFPSNQGRSPRRRLPRLFRSSSRRCIDEKNGFMNDARGLSLDSDDESDEPCMDIGCANVSNNDESHMEKATSLSSSNRAECNATVPHLNKPDSHHDDATKKRAIKLEEDTKLAADTPAVETHHDNNDNSVHAKENIDKDSPVESSSPNPTPVPAPSSPAPAPLASPTRLKSPLRSMRRMFKVKASSRAKPAMHDRHEGEDNHYHLESMSSSVDAPATTPTVMEEAASAMSGDAASLEETAFENEKDISENGTDSVDLSETSKEGSVDENSHLDDIVIPSSSCENQTSPTLEPQSTVVQKEELARGNEDSNNDDASENSSSGSESRRSDDIDLKENECVRVLVDLDDELPCIDEEQQENGDDEDSRTVCTTTTNPTSQPDNNDPPGRLVVDLDDDLSHPDNEQEEDERDDEKDACLSYPADTRMDEQSQQLGQASLATTPGEESNPVNTTSNESSIKLVDPAMTMMKDDLESCDSVDEENTSDTLDEPSGSGGDGADFQEGRDSSAIVPLPVVYEENSGFPQIDGPSNAAGNDDDDDGHCSESGNSFDEAKVKNNCDGSDLFDLAISNDGTNAFQELDGPADADESDDKHVDKEENSGFRQIDDPSNAAGDDDDDDSHCSKSANSCDEAEVKNNCDRSDLFALAISNDGTNAFQELDGPSDVEESDDKYVDEDSNEAGIDNDFASTDLFALPISNDNKTELQEINDPSSPETVVASNDPFALPLGNDNHTLCQDLGDPLRCDNKDKHCDDVLEALLFTDSNNDAPGDPRKRHGSECLTIGTESMETSSDEEDFITAGTERQDGDDNNDDGESVREVMGAQLMEPPMSPMTPSPHQKQEPMESPPQTPHETGTPEDHVSSITSPSYATLWVQSCTSPEAGHHLELDIQELQGNSPKQSPEHRPEPEASVSVPKKSKNSLRKRFAALPRKLHIG